MATPVLVTKLFIPRPRPDRVRRYRLIDRLNEGLHRDLTLVSAPAGFGKTTLLSAWVEEHLQAGTRRSATWLSLDKGDNDLSRFLLHLVQRGCRLCREFVCWKPTKPITPSNKGGIDLISRNLTPASV